MRVPLSWLKEFVPTPLDGRAVAALLVSAGLEVEGVETVGGVTGDLVVGRVAHVEELEGLKKPIRWCQVEVGANYGHPDTPGVRGIICGARNFAVGDLVVVALPGTVLPGDFTIATRKTYGHVSDGMICSARELGLGDEHDGIIVLAQGNVGESAYPILGLGEEVLDIAVTPDRGYALSIRGIARELATALNVEFVDPAETLAQLPPATGQAVTTYSQDPMACDLFVLRTLENFNPEVPSPDWLKGRLIAAGMRSVSLAVDITNYVMLELGQPLHAFDADTIVGALGPRWAKAGEQIETLDHISRRLSPQDLVIADDSGPRALAGLMGGLSSEISATTTRIALEAAHFEPTVMAKMARRHRLSSEASRRFERGVDRMLPPIATARAAALLVELGGAKYAGMDAVETAPEISQIALDPKFPSVHSGLAVADDIVLAKLKAVGCRVDSSAAVWQVAAPSWRPDLTADVDLVEEVIRLVGYDQVPTTLPVGPAGQGLTQEQRLRRRAAVWLAGQGAVEVINYPFIGDGALGALGISDDRLLAVVLANPLSDEQPLLRTTLLPGLLGAAARNNARGAADLAIFEIGAVWQRKEGQEPQGVTNPVRPGVTNRPTDIELAQLNDLLPIERRMVGALLTGDRFAEGWWPKGGAFDWSDAVSFALGLGAELGLTLEVHGVEFAPWHPGRCAALLLDGAVIGHAGELAPGVCTAFGVAPRTVALELDLDALIAAAKPVPVAPVIRTFPVVKEDLALEVPDDVTAAQVLRTLRKVGADLLESVWLFDVYRGSQVAAGHRSLAFALRLRAADRTLEAPEVAQIRENLVAAVVAEHQARLRR